MSENTIGNGYEVGYRRPPLTSRFQKGQSGNRKGRPKGSKNIQPIIMKILNSEIDMYEDGVKKKIPVKEAMYLAQVKKALKGDTRAFEQLIKMMPEEKDERPMSLTVRYVDSNYNELEPN